MHDPGWGNWHFFGTCVTASYFFWKEQNEIGEFRSVEEPTIGEMNQA